MVKEVTNINNRSVVIDRQNRNIKVLFDSGGVRTVNTNTFAFKYMHCKYELTEEEIREVQEMQQILLLDKEQQKLEKKLKQMNKNKTFKNKAEAYKLKQINSLKKQLLELDDKRSRIQSELKLLGVE